MTNKKQFRIKKPIKRKGDKLYSNGKVMIDIVQNESILY